MIGLIQIILGDKGSGKTKRLIDLANESLKNEHGDIIFIDDDKRYMYDLRHEIRFVDASEYPVGKKATATEMLGFICGMLSANFDITLIVMDAFMKLIRTPLADPEMEDFFKKLELLSEAHRCNFLISVSATADNVPEYIQKYVI
jgi:RecA/RadA recombinase